MTTYEKPEIIPIKNDKIFHDLINDEDMDMVEWIVMQILGMSYEEIHGNVKVLNIRLTRKRKKERNKYVDLKIDVNGEIIIIELNCNYSGNPIRNIEYMHTALFKSYGKPNDNIYFKPVRGILVNLNWYPEKANNVKKETPGKEITLWNYPKHSKFGGYYMKIIDINLDYYANLKYDSIKKEDKLFKLLTIDNKEELESLVKDEQLLSKYHKRIIYLSNDKDYWEDMMSEEREEFFRKQNAYLNGYDAGMDKGIEQKQREMVISFYNQGVSLDIISNASNLTISEVEQIINENSKKNNSK